MLKIFIATVYCLFLLLPTVRAQNSAPAKKANQRAAAAPASAKAEPFDKATIETMKTKCVRLETEAGDIELEMFPESAPESVRNFLNLTAIGAFDTTTFSRVVTDFVIQGGNLSTREKMTPELARRSYRKLADEPNRILHERGILSMARSEEPNSASTHFFILLREAPNLDGKFAAFGRVTRGMETVERINKMPVAPDEKPEKPVRIKRASVTACAVSPEARANRVLNR